MALRSLSFSLTRNFDSSSDSVLEALGRAAVSGPGSVHWGDPVWGVLILRTSALASISWPSLFFGSSFS